ncbi:MAG: glucokinase [Defluviimonas denitrificans]
MRLLGAVAGDLALIHVPYAGIFPDRRRVARASHGPLRPFGFAEAFRDKGRFYAFQREFSVAIVEDDYLALAGCALSGGRSGGLHQPR